MSRVRGKDTKPEWRVRFAFHAAGLRYRLHVHGLPGRPDLVFPSRRCAVFIHGCFWHRHPGCPSTRFPKSRVDFWEAKFQENTSRDKQVESELKDLGWQIIVIWECQTKDAGNLAEIAEDIRKIPKIHCSMGRKK